MEKTTGLEIIRRGEAMGSTFNQVVRNIASKECKLQELDFEGHIFLSMEDNFNRFCSSLTVNSSIKKLSLRAKALEINSTLTCLSLRENQLSNTGISILLDSLQVNTGLQRLNLTRNHIGDEAAAHLKSLLEKNHTIKEIILTHNIITDNGAMLINQGLLKNCGIQSLPLRANKITQIRKIEQLITSTLLDRPKRKSNNEKLHIESKRLLNYVFTNVSTQKLEPLLSINRF